MATFVQLGATRDGLDPYLQTARMRGMWTVLIETPDYMQLRRALGRQEFDQTIAIEHPAHVDEVINALSTFIEPPVIILAGFERYIYTAYAVAASMHILPWREDDAFMPLHKAEQRLLITKKHGQIAQPRYGLFDSTDISEDELSSFIYPVVVKPIDGGGGLGVYGARNAEEAKIALSRLGSTTNYDGEDFQGVIVEEYTRGHEYSVQGIANKGIGQLLAFCQKFVFIEPIETEQGFVFDFHETGHIALGDDEIDSGIYQFVQECVRVFDYRDGPFHIDLVVNEGKCSFIEMGFRLSGNGVTRLVQMASGYEWAEEVFALYTAEPVLKPKVVSEPDHVGQITIVTEAEIERAYQLRQQGYSIEVEIFPVLSNPLMTPSLASDIKRHAGTKGRVIVRARTRTEVERLLRSCSPQRATFDKNMVIR